MRKRDFYKNISDDYFKSIVSTSLSIAEVIKTLGLSASGQDYKLVHNRINLLGLDTSHMTGQVWNKGERLLTSPFTFSEIFCKNSELKLSNSTRKARLIELGLRENKCENCGISDNWQGKPLTLQLHHINGDNTDNRVDNLQILCPNCHSQTDNFCAKKRRKDLIIPDIKETVELIRCPFCNEEIPINSNHIDKCQSKYIKSIDKRDYLFKKFIENYENGVLDINLDRHSRMLGKDVYESRKELIFNSGVELKKGCIHKLVIATGLTRGEIYYTFLKLNISLNKHGYTVD